MLDLSTLPPIGGERQSTATHRVVDLPDGSQIIVKTPKLIAFLKDHPTFPQSRWLWEGIEDEGSYKSEACGVNDLDGGAQCDLCQTWHRYGHLISHPDWPSKYRVGQICATVLAGVDAFKLQREFIDNETKRKMAEQKKAADEARRIAWEAGAPQRKINAEKAAAEKAAKDAEQAVKDAEAAEAARQRHLADLQVSRGVIDDHCGSWLDHIYWSGTTLFQNFVVLNLPRITCEITGLPGDYTMTLKVTGQPPRAVTRIADLEDALDRGRSLFLKIATRLAEERAGEMPTNPVPSPEAEAKYQAKVLVRRADAEQKRLEAEERERQKTVEQKEREAAAAEERRLAAAKAEQQRIEAEAEAAELEAKLEADAKARRAKVRADNKVKKAEWLAEVTPEYPAWEQQVRDNIEESRNLMAVENAARREAKATPLAAREQLRPQFEARYTAYRTSLDAVSARMWTLLQHGRLRFGLPFKVKSEFTNTQIEEILAEHGLTRKTQAP